MMQSLLVNARSEAGSNPDQVRLQYLLAYVWLRFWGRPGWASSQHSLVDGITRLGCRIVQVALYKSRTGCRTGCNGRLYILTFTETGADGRPVGVIWGHSD